MLIPFTKMHGLGNDFVVFDATARPVPLSAERVRQLADRRLGIGCDQVLLVQPASDPEADFRYRIFNADGGEVQQCGNGARCLARFVRDAGLTDRDRIVVETGAGRLALQFEADGRISVDMGRPRFEPAAIPFRAEAEALDYPVPIPAPATRMAVLGLGNPHAVIRVEDVAAAPVAEIGEALGQAPEFPEGVNVGFMEVVSPDRIRLRVHERGAGETRACGSGACAAAVAGRRWGLLEAHVTVALPGGELAVSWNNTNDTVTLTGPAQRVFEGRIEL